VRTGVTIHFQVKNIDPILDFYKNHLPFIILDYRNFVGSGRELTVRPSDSVDIRLCFQERHEDKLLHYANTPLKLEFAHKNLANFKKKLIDAGIDFEELEVEVPWIWKISVLDPYGNTLTFSKADNYANQ
jgi:hypothetical protein